jgi:hypothetical protein
MLGGPTVKQLWELAGQQPSTRAIARELDLSRNTVRKDLFPPAMTRVDPPSSSQVSVGCGWVAGDGKFCRDLRHATPEVSNI